MDCWFLGNNDRTTATAVTTSWDWVFSMDRSRMIDWEASTTFIQRERSASTKTNWDKTSTEIKHVSWKFWKQELDKIAFRKKWQRIIPVHSSSSLSSSHANLAFCDGIVPLVHERAVVLSKLDAGQKLRQLLLLAHLRIKYHARGENACCRGHCTSGSEPTASSMK